MADKTYAPGAVKQDDETKAVAVRRDTPPDDPMAWGVMTLANGGHYAPLSDITDWADK